MIPVITSLSLDEQLVLELEGWVEVLKLLELLPRSVLCWKAVSLDEVLPNTPAKRWRCGEPDIADW